MRKRSAPQVNVRGPLLAFTQGVSKQDEQGRERERGKGGGRNSGVGSQKAGLSGSLLASGPVSHLTSSLSHR